MLNSLVMAGAMLYEVDFNILADIPSGPFDLETSREPNINSISSSVQRRYDGHNEGSVSGRSSQVSGGSDRLKSIAQVGWPSLNWSWLLYHFYVV